jgi:hypothetical protein
MPTFHTTYAGQQQKAAFEQSTTGHSASSTSGSSSSSSRSYQCFSPTEAQVTAEKNYMELISKTQLLNRINNKEITEDALTVAEQNQLYDERMYILSQTPGKKYSREWMGGVQCYFYWKDNAEYQVHGDPSNQGGGKRRRSRKIKKNRKAKSHKRR